MAAVEYPGPQRRCGRLPRARCASRVVELPRSRRGGGDQASGEMRAPLLAASAVVVLLVAGWPAADLVAHLGRGHQSAVPEAVDTEAPPPPPAAGQELHVVQPGETYWSIVEGLDVPGDPRPAVDAVMAANGGRRLQAGDALVLPPVRARQVSR